MAKENHKINQALDCLSPNIKRALESQIVNIKDKITDIHLRLDRPVCVSTRMGNHVLSIDTAVNKSDLQDTFNRICRYSVYSVQGEIINGFVTVAGGHRAGICGTAVVNNGEIINIRDISSVNIRVSREIKGCAESLLNSLDTSSGVLICGEPCSGKTTILRDIARYISTKENKTVSLIDERGELAATMNGENQNDVGLCDVFSGYPKHKAVEQALRCMSPQYIICDELGTADDITAIESCVNSGVSVIAAMHASNKNELINKPNARRLISTGAFESIVFLENRRNAGQVKEIIKAGELLAD